MFLKLIRTVLRAWKGASVLEAIGRRPRLFPGTRGADDTPSTSRCCLSPVSGNDVIHAGTLERGGKTMVPSPCADDQVVGEEELMKGDLSSCSTAQGERPLLHPPSCAERKAQANPHPLHLNQSQAAVPLGIEDGSAPIHLTGSVRGNKWLFLTRAGHASSTCIVISPGQGQSSYLRVLK
ncbi:hypothetical protein AAFF_G00225980 [Aldrovandia affinis]|uniref:Uncharacterized protein n=1 Tax=Aldrovandia affinis TaxID=143900 RepID=A0AAD7TB90_9TELE|nr:hypothetical protein AAFF_G00225980 [Aldrovandia affinis]